MKTFPTSAAWCFGILFISVSLITTESSEVVGSADPVVALAGDDVILPCSLKPSVGAEDMTVEWTGLYLKTRNVHLYRQGRDSNVEQFPSYRGRTSMFHEELKNGNVSLKLTRVTLSDAGSYMCFIPTLTGQVKETTVQLFVGAVSQPVISINHLKETEIHVPDDLFPKSYIVLIVGLSIAVAVAVLASLAGVYMWRKCTKGEFNLDL
ncbi:myelin-oligodendrocyte glycoprotein-like isoform X3 [Salvelinus sp. IW2-2015]|uniref:myelin-oligodendrocyte glycoprotein-like isoform X3 n=1 Tax=Salvelinus sp. IW2-2015 TaxID=2691554 RepID=UPI0038D4DADC